jgi:hypothetical protein
MKIGQFLYHIAKQTATIKEKNDVVKERVIEGDAQISLGALISSAEPIWIWLSNAVSSGSKGYTQCSTYGIH